MILRVPAKKIFDDGDALRRAPRSDAKVLNQRTESNCERRIAIPTEAKNLIHNSFTFAGAAMPFESPSPRYADK